MPEPFPNDPQHKVLADGTRIPRIGLGVWQAEDGQQCIDAVRWALEAGYRHIDTAQGYGNEKSVGQGIRESGVPREEIFITTKFFPGSTDPVAEAEASLRRLGTDYVDLYIIHWPQGGPTWAWPGMERARELGHARSIGVSNFDVDELEEVMAVASVPPVVDQVQFSPFEYRRGLQEAAEGRGVALEAYSPLGTGRHLSDPVVTAVAEGIGRSPAQVLVRWSLQRDLIVLPKSVTKERIVANLAVLDFTLSDEDMAALDGLDRTNGTTVAQEFKWW
jgi:diketogulonate reductase-like aldo/keto reductase